MVGGHGEDEQQLHHEHRAHGVAAEPGDDVTALAPELHAGREADDRQQRAGHHRPPREEQEAAVAIERGEQALDVAAGNVDALQRGEAQLDRLHHRLPAVAGQRLAQPRGRREREELGALQLAHQVRDDVEVEGAVTQDVGGGDLLQRRAAVHLLPQELLGLGEQQEAVGGGVLEDEAALTGHARGDLGQLVGLARHALRP